MSLLFETGHKSASRVKEPGLQEVHHNEALDAGNKVYLLNSVPSSGTIFRLDSMFRWGASKSKYPKPKNK